MIRRSVSNFYPYPVSTSNWGGGQFLNISHRTDPSFFDSCATRKLERPVCTQRCATKEKYKVAMHDFWLIETRVDETRRGVWYRYLYGMVPFTDEASMPVRVVILLVFPCFLFLLFFWETDRNAIKLVFYGNTLRRDHSQRTEA